MLVKQGEEVQRSTDQTKAQLARSDVFRTVHYMSALIAASVCSSRGGPGCYQGRPLDGSVRELSVCTQDGPNPCCSRVSGELSVIGETGRTRLNPAVSGPGRVTQVDDSKGDGLKAASDLPDS